MTDRLCLCDIGAKLRSLREVRGLSLAQVAEATGQAISRANLMKVEAGRVDTSLLKIAALARLYHISIDDLVGLTSAGSR